MTLDGGPSCPIYLLRRAVLRVVSLSDSYLLRMESFGTVGEFVDKKGGDLGVCLAY
jgi:hypothetical protein